MSIGKFLYFLILIFTMINLLGCGENEVVNGGLLYSGGGGIIKMAEFGAVPRDTTIYINPGVSDIDSVIRLGNGEVIFGVCDVIGSCNIKKIQPGLSDAAVLRSGHLTSYLVNYKSLFFYDSSDDGDVWLFVAKIDSLTAVNKIAKKPKPQILKNGFSRDITVAPIPISEKEVVFLGSDARLWVYNAENSSSSRLNVDLCYPYLWISSTQELLCGDMDSKVPFTLDILSSKKKQISSLQGGYGFVYVPRYDAIIYGKTRLEWLLHEASDIFMYSLVDGSQRRLEKDAYLSHGIWLESK